MTALRTLFGSFLGNWQLVAGALAIGLALGGAGTWRVMSWHAQAQQVQVVTKTIKQIQYQDRVTTQVVTKYLTVKAADTAHTETALQGVITHVTPQADVACPVPLGFVRVFNDAAHGPVPDAAAGPDDAASGVALSDVAKATVQNGGNYDAVAHQLTALQDWIRQQRAWTEKAP